MFLTGPGVVSEVTGEDVDMAALGGPRVHERNGVCHFIAPTEVDGALLARDLLDYLPQHAGERAAALAERRTRPRCAPDRAVPAQARKVYDIRDVAARARRRRAPAGGQPALVAQRRLRVRPSRGPRDRDRRQPAAPPRRRARRDASQKAARFVRTCNSFGLPLLVLVDTPGFLPGSRQERDGVIRHGAKLVHAFAEASVPRVTVIVRKAFGGAFIAMNSKDLGADYVFAWPGAELGVMGAEQAVEILNRREIEAAEDPAAHGAGSPAPTPPSTCSVEGASADGFVDEVIAPDATRERVAACLEALADVHRPESRAGNIPLWRR